MPRHTATDQIRQAPSEPQKIVIPHRYTPRSYERRMMAFADQGQGKRLLNIWHRRSGKTKTWINQIAKHMVLAPFCGTYLHIFPTLTQGRRDAWDAKGHRDEGGMPFRAHFPPELVLESSETEMQITFRPMPHQQPQPVSDGRGGKKYLGSVYQVMGTDKDSLENLRGINAAGVVFEEYPQQDPSAWQEILQPVLTENGGWAAFPFTPKGKNHAWKLYQDVAGLPGWFTEVLTVDDTRKDAPGEHGGPVITQADLDQMRQEGTPEETIQQEYYCSFEGALVGTVFGDLLRQARAAGRVGQVPWITGLPVGTMWDIGRTDGTAVWFFQCVGSEIRLIDYYANRRQGAEHYAKVLREKPYLYGRVILPTDAKATGYTATENTAEFLERTVCRTVDIAGKLPIQEGIAMVRRFFSRFIFNADRLSQKPSPEMPAALDSLDAYRYHPETGRPVHDEHSHCADALRTGIVGWQEGAMDFLTVTPRPIEVVTAFDPRVVSVEADPFDMFVGGI